MKTTYIWAPIKTEYLSLIRNNYDEKQFNPFDSVTYVKPFPNEWTNGFRLQY